MSTNYYFKTEDSEEKIHIGQRAAGWRPLLQVTRFYDDFADLVNFYRFNQQNLKIVDEYGNQYDWQELTDNLFNWGNGSKNCSYRDHEDYVDVFGYQWVEMEFT